MDLLFVLLTLQSNYEMDRDLERFPSAEVIKKNMDFLNECKKHCESQRAIYKIDIDAQLIYFSEAQDLYYNLYYAKTSQHESYYADDEFWESKRYYYTKFLEKVSLYEYQYSRLRPPFPYW